MADIPYRKSLKAPGCAFVPTACVKEIIGIDTVQAFSLEDLVEQQNFDSVDLMKMDCEGADYEILLNAPSQTLALVDRIIMEYHDLGENWNPQVLSTFLEKEGFQVRRYENKVHAEIGYLFATRIF